MPFREMMRHGPEMMMEFSKEGSGSIGIAIAASMFKDTMPWIYEVGMEAYRQSLFGDNSAAKLSLQEFKQAARFSGHPMFREFVRNDKELMFFGQEIDMFLTEIEHRRELNPKFRRPK
jgi:hypothetical protein